MNPRRYHGLPARKMTGLRKGTRLCHGTAAKERFDIPDGPAWFSNEAEVCDYFTGWHGEKKSRHARVQWFRVAEPGLRLVRVDNAQDLEGIVADAGEEPYEGRGSEDLAELACGLYDGWTIPDNYGPGKADVMICDPERWLEPQAPRPEAGMMGGFDGFARRTAFPRCAPKFKP